MGEPDECHNDYMNLSISTAIKCSIPLQRMLWRPTTIMTLSHQPSRPDDDTPPHSLPLWIPPPSISPSCGCYAQVVISSAFESSCGISVLVQLAAALQPVVVHPPHSQGGAPVSHGLGTLSWFGSDVAPHPLRIYGQGSSRSGSGSDGIDPGASRPYSACVEDASLLLQGLSDGARHTLQPLLAISSSSSSSSFASSADDPSEEVMADRRLTRLQIPVQIRISDVEDPVSYIIRGTQIQPSGPNAAELRRQSSPSRSPFVFLHGFLGSSEDWTPFMRAVAEGGHLAVALDLPGHGRDTPETLRPPFLPPTSSAFSDHNNGNSPPGGRSDSGDSGSRLGPDGTNTDAAAAAASSAPPGGYYYGIEAVADAVAAAIRQQLPGTSRLLSGGGGGGGGGGGRRGGTVLVGYSMGARVALAVTARHPGLVASLVLVSGSAGIEVRGKGRG